MAEKKHKEPFIPRSSGERVAHARRLLGVREGRDILPSDLAELVGVTVNAVYAWELGTVPGPANFKRLAEVLGVPVEWLHYGIGGTPLATFKVPDKIASALSASRRAKAADAPPEDPADALSTDIPPDVPDDPPRARAAGDRAGPRRGPKRPKDQR